MKDVLLGIIFMTVTIFFNLFATHLRTSKWFTYKLRWQISIILAIIGIIGITLPMFFNFNRKGEFIILITPLIFTIIDKFFMFISYKYQNRDFQFNTSMETWLNQHRKGISMWDNIITVASLLIIIGLFGLSSIIVDIINNAP